jgi:hypothetical protein
LCELCVDREVRSRGSVRDDSPDGDGMRKDWMRSWHIVPRDAKEWFDSLASHDRATAVWAHTWGANTLLRPCWRRLALMETSSLEQSLAACLGTRSNKVMSPAALPNNHAALPVCAAVPVFG